MTLMTPMTMLMIATDDHSPDGYDPDCLHDDAEANYDDGAMMLVGDACDIGMTLDCDIRFDLKSISSHVRRRCCSQPGASLEVDFKSLKGGMSKHKKGLKIDFDFLGHPPKPNLKLNLSLSHAPHCD